MKQTIPENTTTVQPSYITSKVENFLSNISERYNILPEANKQIPKTLKIRDVISTLCSAQVVCGGQ